MYRSDLIGLNKNVFGDTFPFNIEVELSVKSIRSGGITVKRPKFGNGPLVRHPLSELLKNHISAGIEVRNLV
jgi:hypothetical protein